MERLYSIPNAAQALGGVSPKTVETWLSHGRLLRTKVGRRTMIAESEINRFIADGRKTPDSRDSRQEAA